MKSYFQHDPILDKGKAEPKPATLAHIHKPRFWVDGGSPEPTRHNSRVRMSKKRRIALRDAEAVLKDGASGIRASLRRQFRAYQMAGALQALRTARNNA